MFKFTGSVGALDAVRCFEGRFSWHPMVKTAELTMVYTNSKSGETYGSCLMRESLMRQETRDALEKFLSLAEEDFATALNPAEKPTEPIEAESPGGLGNPFRRE